MRSTDTQKETIIVRVMICSYFEEEYLERIRAVDERIQILYREDLVPPLRWPGDHVGPPQWRRSSGDEEEFLAMLGEAEVFYDFPRGHVEDLVRIAPRLRWVQASIAGAGEVAEKAGLQQTDVIVTPPPCGAVPSLGIYYSVPLRG